MKRYLFIIAACLLAGAAANLLVAWGLSCRAAKRRPIELRQPAESIHWPIEVPPTWGPPTEIAVLDRVGVREVQVRHLSRDAMHYRRIDNNVALLDDQLCRAWTLDAGFPFLSVRACGRDSWPRWNPTSILPVISPSAEEPWYHGVLMPAWIASALIQENEAVLPVEPLWWGWSANTLLYGGFFGGIAVGFPAFVRVCRRRRGHCPNCNYNLLGNLAAGCPECGLGRA